MVYVHSTASVSVLVRVFVLSFTLGKGAPTGLSVKKGNVFLNITTRECGVWCVMMT